MVAGTSNKGRTLSKNSNRSIAIGKGKVVGEGPALSLQDVFSDSANLAGRQQKTSCPSETRQGNWVATPKKETGRPSKTHGSGGRKKLPQSQLKTRKLQVHVTELEHQQIHGLYKLSGMRYLSDYLRMRILDTNRSKIIVNKHKLVKQIDKLGTEINRIGNNINQIAKYANIQLKTGKMDENTMIMFNAHMEHYLKDQKDLINAYRALVRNKE